MEVFPEIMHDPLFSCYFNLIFRPNDFNLTFRPIFDDMAMECVVKSVIPKLHEKFEKKASSVLLMKDGSMKESIK